MHRELRQFILGTITPYAVLGLMLGGYLRLVMVSEGVSLVLQVASASILFPVVVTWAAWLASRQEAEAGG